MSDENQPEVDESGAPDEAPTQDTAVVEETAADEVEDAIDEATRAVEQQVAALDDDAPSARGEGSVGLDRLLDVSVDVTVEIGRARMSLAELIGAGPGALVRLDRAAHEPADILVNGKVVAQGEVLTLGESYAVRITSVEGAP